MQMQLPVSFSISRKKASLAQAEIAPKGHLTPSATQIRRWTRFRRWCLMRGMSARGNGCFLLSLSTTSTSWISICPAAVKRILTFIRAIQPNSPLFRSFSLDLTSPFCSSNLGEDWRLDLTSNFALFSLWGEDSIQLHWLAFSMHRAIRRMNFLLHCGRGTGRVRGWQWQRHGARTIVQTLRVAEENQPTGWSCLAGHLVLTG